MKFMRYMLFYAVRGCSVVVISVNIVLNLVYIKFNPAKLPAEKMYELQVLQEEIQNKSFVQKIVCAMRKIVL